MLKDGGHLPSSAVRALASGSANGGIVNVRSSEMRRGARLVARTVSRGQATRSSAMWARRVAKARDRSPRWRADLASTGFLIVVVRGGTATLAASH